MALQKQQVPISFAEGVDTKTDDKQVLATKLLQLENGIFTKKGQIRKRFGYDILRKSIISEDADITSATGITTLKTELVLFNGVKLYSYIEASEAWTEKGTSTSATTSSRSIIKNNYQQANQDYGYNNGLGCYVWKDSVGGVRYSLIDEVSGTFITQNASLSGTGISPRVVGIGQYFFIYYIEGTSIKFRYIQISTPTVLTAAIDLSTTVDPVNKIYDVQKVGERVYICYNTNNASSSISIFYQASNKIISNELEFTTEEAVGGISLVADSSNNIWVSYANSTQVKYFIVSYGLDVTVLVPTLIETISTVRNIASIMTDTTQATFLYEETSSPANFVKKNTGTITGTVGSASVFVRSVGLASKFFDYNDEHNITLVHSSTLQSTYFVYTLNGDIVTKINQNVAGGYTSSSILPTVVEISSGKFVVPTLRKGQLESENGNLFTSLGVNATIVDFVSLNNFVTAELADSLHIVGGTLQTYDGNTVNESGFNVFPEGVAAVQTDVGAGNIANGTYQVSALYAWTDNLGQIHRSAPSIPVEVVLTSGPDNINVTVPTLRISKKNNVFIEVYRTEKDGDIFYKVTSDTSLTLNDPTADTIVFKDTISDANLISRAILYTTGGVLENIAPPPSSIIVNWKNRIILKPTEEENVLQYSKIREEGGPVEFCDVLRMPVDPVGGDISAFGVLDDKLIIFKESQIHMLAGDGPNNLGLQSDFGLPQLITADAGCVDVNSVVQTPVGLMFKSKKGIYLLNRGLSAGYIGAEVEAYNSSRITSAKLISESNQVRFTTEDNLCLVYDYFFNQWSTFTNHESVGATIYQDKFVFVKDNGDVYKEDTSYTDGSQSIKIKLVSSWLQVGAIEGFQRLYKLVLLGEYKSAHRLKIKVGYDFNTNFTQEVEIDAGDVMNLTTYGEDSPYGSGTPYGGAFPLYQWRIFPKRQKCQSFRVSIEDIFDDTFGESFNISAMRLEVGVKQGSNKLATDKSYGTS